MNFPEHHLATDAPPPCRQTSEPNARHATAFPDPGIHAIRPEDLPPTPANTRDLLREVAAPPRRFIGAGEFRRALALLRQGFAISYEGASGAVDFDESGDVRAPIEIWRYAGGESVTCRMEYRIAEE